MHAVLFLHPISRLNTPSSLSNKPRPQLILTKRLTPASQVRSRSPCEIGAIGIFPPRIRSLDAATTLAFAQLSPPTPQPPYLPTPLRACELQLPVDPASQQSQMRIDAPPASLGQQRFSPRNTTSAP